MYIKYLLNKAILGVLVLLVLTSTFFLSNGYASGLVIGVPSPCMSKISVSGPSSINMYPGEMTSFNVSIYNVSCGISRVALSFYSFPDSWYTVSPNYITAIAPGEVKDFSVYIDLPLDIRPMVYVSPYKIYTNEGNFIAGELELNVIVPKKPKRGPLISHSSTETQIEGKKNGLTTENLQFWYWTAILSSFLAIAMISSEYFKFIRETKKARRKRIGKELSKILTRNSKKL